MSAPSRTLVVLLAVAAILLLAVTWSMTGSINALLGVGAVFALITVVPMALSWLASRGGPETLTSQNSIRLRLQDLRENASTVSAIWSGEYDTLEVKRYFEDEKKALATNPQLKIRRVINPSVIPDEHFDLLQSIREQFGDRFTLLEDSTIRSFELYIADYPGNSGQESVAVIVINNTLTNRPAVALVLDPARDKSLAGAVDAVRRWWNTIREDLPAFDPVAVERWDHIARRYTKLVTENSNQIEFLDQYSRSEKQIVSDHLRSLADQGHRISLVEIGCGDGRALLSYIPAELARSTEYVFGLDYAPAMINAAEGEVARVRRMKEMVRPDAKMLINRTAFFQLNAAHVRRYFDDGRLHELEQLQEASELSVEGGIDHANYGASQKVFCCLLNTLGVIEPAERRLGVLTSMLGCLGVGDGLILTVFAAERFRDEAPALYGELEELIDAEVTAEQFDDATATFKVPGTPGYYSHWFTERELRSLANDAIAALEREGRAFAPPHLRAMGDDGYAVVVERAA
jgi:hypothetical protein